MTCMNLIQATKIKLSCHYSELRNLIRIDKHNTELSTEIKNALKC